MKLASLEIRSTRAQTAQQTERGTLRIKQHQAGMQINHKKDVIEINTTYPKLSIDQTEAFADANLKSGLRLAKEFYASASSQVSEHIAKKRQEGDQMMRIEHGYGGAFSRIAKQNSTKSQPQLHVVNMPRSVDQTKIHFQPSQISFNVPRHVADITINRREPDIHMPKWQTDTYLRQKNSISFQAVGASINRGL
ncbi:hypothetical protein AB685_24040 [Bacillus sp. LL01]|uniref:DUF6470 family protein n=1 Tax=Bacillus sp. LL01 TaxID=1665556 RepID=UPI00064D3048|nr:DUF6470 family protein [Bacillus sp. LL01]KMJ56039.1 hypothetical protein AB685_24040 [Bacillus sp. LL01]